MTIYELDNMIRLWNVQKWECFQKIKNIYSQGIIHSGNFLFENNEIFIITSNNIIKGKSQPIKVFDLKGNKIKEIKNSCEGTLFIDSFYDNIKKVTYIITCNKNYVISYDYNKNELYHKYYDEEKNEKREASDDELDDDENGISENEIIVKNDFFITVDSATVILKADDIAVKKRCFHIHVTDNSFLLISYGIVKDGKGGFAEKFNAVACCDKKTAVLLVGENVGFIRKNIFKGKFQIIFSARTYENYIVVAEIDFLTEWDIVKLNGFACFTEMISKGFGITRITV